MKTAKERVEIIPTVEYGRERWNPGNDFAKMLCAIKKKNTLSEIDIRLLVSFGYPVVYRGPRSLRLDQLGIKKVTECFRAEEQQ